jgi:hypothetical protein
VAASPTALPLITTTVNLPSADIGQRSVLCWRKCADTTNPSTVRRVCEANSYPLDIDSNSKRNPKTDTTAAPETTSALHTVAD